MILEPKKIVCHSFCCFPIYLPWSDGTGCHDLSFFWMLSFKPAFSLSSFTFIKRFFSSSSLSAIRLVSSSYLRLLILLLTILIPACVSSSLAFCMMYSVYKANKQCNNIQPWHTAFPILNQSVVQCKFLALASWPAYRFLRRQVRWFGCSHHLQWFWSPPPQINLDSIWKSRDITLPTKVNLVKASYGFSSSHVWMWELDYKETWALKNWCFGTVWCWRRLLRVPWTAKRSNQSILKEINLEYSLEGLMLKQKIQYFGHLMRRTNSLKRPWC